MCCMTLILYRYDPEIYERVWTHMLRHRPTSILHMTQLLPTGEFSAYDYKCPLHVIQPTASDIEEYYAKTTKCYQHLHLEERDKTLNQECDAWFVS